MSKRRKRINQRIYKEQAAEIKRQIAERTRRVIIILSACFSTILLILMFRVGESVYPAWMVEHRTRIIAILALGLILTVTTAPLVIEVNSNPRRLSGVGKYPKWGVWY